MPTVDVSDEVFINIGIEGYCTCGNSLEIKEISSDGTACDIKVEPCEKCLDSAYKDGQSDY